MSVVIETTLGDITVDLYLKERPNTCLNFLKLCKIKYYNLCLFHKIERNFIAQTGDPTGTGRGGESVFCHLYGDQAKYFDIENKPRLKHEKRGTLSMVNNGNNMNGSQFFITLGENLTYLDDDHSVFGEVAEGFDILLKLNEAICDDNNRPYQDVRITHTVVLHDPFDDPVNLSIPDASPEPTKEQLESNYIGADEEIDDTKGKSMEEIEEKIKESEAKARATILEMVGDIPDADVKPPENVLFVCKLNPVTTSEDLEIIFSRFGTIVSCEVIKDKKTGESLQYAFIEFEKEEDCENAYFKMDNVLIDDRRIHVDFSQSVSKMNLEMQNKFKNQKSGKSQTYVIKNQTKSSDGYDMIFDMEDDSNRSSKAEIKQHHSSRTNKDSSKYNDRDKSSKRSQPSEQRYIDEHRRRKRQPNSPVPHRLSQKAKYDTADYEKRQYSSAYSRSRKEEYRYDKTNYDSSHRRKRSFSPDPVRSCEKRLNSPNKFSRLRDEYSSSPERSRVNERPATDKHRRDREHSYDVEVSRSRKLSPRSDRMQSESKRKLEKKYSHKTVTKNHSITLSDRSVSPRGHSSSKRKTPKKCSSSSDSDSSSSSSSSDNVKRQTSVQHRRKQEKYNSVPKSKSRSPSEARQKMKKSSSSYSKKARHYSSSPEVPERENKSMRSDDYEFLDRHGSKSSHSKRHKSGPKNSKVSHGKKHSYRADDEREFQSKKHKSRRSSS